MQVGFSKIPKFVMKRASVFLHNMNSRFALIAPSKWMLLEAKKSSLLKDKTMLFISNTLDASIPNVNFRPIPANTQIRLGVASMSSISYVKGGDLTRELEIEFEAQGLPFKFVYMNNYPQNGEGFSDFWGSIDYLVVLSRAENSPNVIHEAKRIGIPVIASNIGGIRELLDEDFDIGIDEVDLNKTSILAKLNAIQSSKRTSVNKERMQERFHQYTAGSIMDHIALYRKLSEESSNL